jgi:predicted nucleic acid-binding Zn ribbon protein
VSHVDPRPVAESLDRVTKWLGAPRARELATLFSQWEAVVGREIAQHTEPRSLRGGVLILLVDQPAWATQLRYLGPELLARIHAAVGGSAVTEIQIRVAGQAGSTGGMGRGARRREERLPGLDGDSVDRRSHPPLVEWDHRSSGR